jgi:hypothetical protein
MRAADKFPSILAVVDSLFWYPLPDGSLLSNPGPLVAGSRLPAVIISGGGNDFAAINDLRPLPADHRVGCATAADCFRAGGEKGSLDWPVAKVRDSFIALIDQVIGATWAPTGEAAIWHRTGRCETGEGP